MSEREKEEQEKKKRGREAEKESERERERQGETGPVGTRSGRRSPVSPPVSPLPAPHCPGPDLSQNATGGGRHPAAVSQAVKLIKNVKLHHYHGFAVQWQYSCSNSISCRSNSSNNCSSTNTVAAVVTAALCYH